MPNKKEVAMNATYEEAVAKLEESVRNLEKGNLTLEESLKAFEEGIKWSRICEGKLSEAKGKVETLIKKAGGEAEVKEFGINEHQTLLKNQEG